MNTLQSEHEIIKAFFQTDSAAEIINSLTFMTESLLCTENMENMSLEIRMHIVNQIRVTNLISQLSEHYRK
jgi:adenosylmethionine-8-amino-7-oxononanoate aminotransferase